MDSNQKVLLVSLGIGVGVAAVVAGGVYLVHFVSSDERRRVIKTSNPVSVEMRIPIKVQRLSQNCHLPVATYSIINIINWFCRFCSF